MEAILAIVVGGLYGAGLYLILRRSIIKILVGLGLIGHAANLLIFTAAGTMRDGAPIVPAGAQAPIGPQADPLPQALILTAIVIGFGILGFAIALVHRTVQVFGTDDPDRIRSEETAP